MDVSPIPPKTRRSSAATRRFRAFNAFAFSFAWVPVMYTAFTRDRGFTPDQYQTLWSVYYLTMVVAELPWGWVADRFGTRPLLVLGPLLLGSGFVVLGHSDSIAMCMACMAVTGAGHAMISGADGAYLYELLLSEGRPEDALREESAAWIARLAGVSVADLLGGWTAQRWGTPSAFDVSLLLMLFASLAAFSLPPVRPAERVRPRPLAALRRMVEPSLSWVVCWYAVVFVLVRTGFQLYQPTLLDRGVTSLGWHGGLFSLLNLLAAGATLLVPFVFRRFEERGTASFVLALLTLSFAGLAFGAGGLGRLVPLFALQQVGFAFLQPVGRTALNQRIGSSDRASMLSAQSLLARLAFGSLLWAGRWDDALDEGLDTTYLVLAGAALMLGVVLHISHRAGRRRGIS